MLLVCAMVFALPLILNNDFLLNKVARYLVFGILTVSLALSWGYGGILNLGQAMSFGLGSYAMAMALKLKTIPVQTGAGGLPDFMVWNNVTAATLVLGAVQFARFCARGRRAGAGARGRGARLVHVPRPRHRRLRGDHHARHAWSCSIS